MTLFEQKVKLSLERENPDCIVLRNGWPDFAVNEKATGKIRKTIEAKGLNDFIRPNQTEMHKAIRASNIPVEVRYECGSEFINTNGEIPNAAV